MTGEFTSYCNLYYKLTKLHSEREESFNGFLNNAPVYSGETNLSEVDAIITYYREVQAAKAKMDEIFLQIKDTERIILMIMRHFEIPPGTVLNGIIPNELKYEIWADENDALTIEKTKSLDQEPDNPNIMEIDIAWSEDVRMIDKRHGGVKRK